MTNAEWTQYHSSVLNDFLELKEQYPFSTLYTPPTAQPKPAIIRTVAANKELIMETRAVEPDFLGEYSRELFILVPVDYQEKGCKVYGAKWLDTRRFENKDLHFYDDKLPNPHGRLMCVGLTEAFPLMKNVILENVKTAENMLIAYERVMTGVSAKLELIAYAHGDDGIKQFRRNKARYTSKRLKND